VSARAEASAAAAERGAAAHTAELERLRRQLGEAGAREGLAAESAERQSREQRAEIGRLRTQCEALQEGGALREREVAAEAARAERSAAQLQAMTAQRDSARATIQEREKELAAAEAARAERSTAQLQAMTAQRDSARATIQEREKELAAVRVL
jgi:SMC interacting uncharacterized protein involved in chromosome segregation